DLANGTKEFVLVDVEKATRLPAFDHDKLAAGLAKATDIKVEGEKLPFQTIEFVENGRALRFSVKDSVWKCDLSSYECKAQETAPKNDNAAPVEPKGDERDESQNSYDPLDTTELSPEEWAEVEVQVQQKGQKKGLGQKK